MTKEKEDVRRFKSHVSKISKGKHLYKYTEIINGCKYVFIECKEHGDFRVNSKLLMRNKYRCVECSMQTERLDFIKKANKVHNNYYIYDKLIYLGKTANTSAICPKHGEFIMNPHDHVRGVRCMGCFQETNRGNVTEFIAKAIRIHGSIYDYSKVEYKTGDDLVYIGCPMHGLFKQKPRVHLDGHGCTECHVSSTRLGRDRFIELARKVHGEKFNYDKVVYVGNKIKVEIKCPVHGSFMIRPNSHVSSKNGCSRCIESKGETRIRLFLETHGVDYRKEYKLNSSKRRYDFYIPSAKLLIEYHGQQHFKPVELFGGVSQFKDNLYRDELKRRSAREAGYDLREIGHWYSREDYLERYLEDLFRYKQIPLDESKVIRKHHGPRLLATVN